MSSYYLGNDCVFPQVTAKVSLENLKDMVRHGIKHMLGSLPPYGCVPINPEEMVLDKSYYIYGYSYNSDCCLIAVFRTNRDIYLDCEGDSLPEFIRESFNSQKLWYKRDIPE